MASVPQKKLTAEEYLAIERAAEYKSEFYRGEMFAMTGASRKHNLIAVNTTRELSTQLRDRDCEVYGSDMRVKVDRTGLYTYPDVVVVCGEPRFEDAEVDTLLNPTVLFEVLSKSTEGYDKGAKFDQYRKLPTLKEYVLVGQDKCHVMHYVRQPDDEWLLSETTDLNAALKLPSINCTVPVAEIYFKVDLSHSDTEASDS